jgi:hypothetical protein
MGSAQKFIEKRTGAIRFVMLEAKDTRDTSIYRPVVYFAKTPDAPRSEWAVFAAWAFHQRYTPVAEMAVS